MCIEQITVITNKDDQNVIEIYKIYARKRVRCLNQNNTKLVEYLVRYCFVLFLFLSRLWFFFSVCLLVFLLLASFSRDVWQPLTQIRLSLSVSLGAGQIIFLTGINATENTVSVVFIYSWFFLLFRGLKDSLENNMKKPQKLFFSLAGSLRPSSSFLAVFPDGSFLLDAGGRNLFLPVCCESL